MGRGLFDFWPRFGSVTGGAQPAPSPKPRQKPKILPPVRAATSGMETIQHHRFAEGADEAIGTAGHGDFFKQGGVEHAIVVRRQGQAGRDIFV